MIEARGETVIKRSAADVFEFVADARNEPNWLPGAESVKKVTPGDVGLGTVFEGRYRGAGRVRLEVVQFDPPKALTFRARARIVTFDDRITLHEQDASTHLTAIMEAQPVGIMRLVGPLMARTMKRQFAANWDALRGPLEDAQPASGSTGGATALRRR
jgi:carbon monoxide dehydrogenase subunit G